MSESNFEEDGFDSDVLMTLLDTKQDSSYALDLQSIRIAQLNDDNLMSMVEKRIVSRVTNNTNYTFKSVKSIELIHKNNRTLVSKSKQQSVLDYYHKILAHPGEK